MFVPITINFNDIIDQFNISKSQCEDVVDYAIKNVTAEFASQWEETAKRELKSTRSRYISNLRVVDEGRMSGAVILDYSKDSLIQMLEEGASPFDMKEGFSKSAKKHTKVDGQGWYMTIPFKLGSPGSISAGFTVLPSQLYNIVKEKPFEANGRTKGLTAGEIGSGGGVPQKYQIPTSRASIVVIPTSKAFEEYQHKTNIFKGAFKQKDSVTGQSSYGSFRRVSDLSDSNSWIYSGMDSKNLAEKALNDFQVKEEKVLQASIDNALSFFGLN